MHLPIYLLSWLRVASMLSTSDVAAISPMPYISIITQEMLRSCISESHTLAFDRLTGYYPSVFCSDRLILDEELLDLVAHIVVQRGCMGTLGCSV